jgi:hypothetical protein
MVNGVTDMMHHLTEQIGTMQSFMDRVVSALPQRRATSVANVWSMGGSSRMLVL